MYTGGMYDNPPPIAEASSNMGADTNDLLAVSDDMQGLGKGPMGIEIRPSSLGDGTELRRRRLSTAVNKEERPEDEEKEGGEKRRDSKGSIAPMSSSIDWFALGGFVFNVFFIVICSILTFSTCSSATYYYTKQMSDLFTATQEDVPLKKDTFNDIANIDDIWKYLNNQFLKGLYWDPDVAKDNDTEHGMIFYENRIVGLPRIRQLRIKDGSCKVQEFGDFIDSCYAKWANSEEETASFRPDDFINTDDDNITAFDYSTAAELDKWYSRAILTAYPGGGFMQALSNTDRNGTADLFAYLQSVNWIGRPTRGVFIDLIVYNANMNLFCVIWLKLDISPTGGAIPSSEFNSIDLYDITSSLSHWRHILEIICVVLMVIFAVMEVGSLFMRGFYDYFVKRIFWTVVSWGQIGVTIVGLFVWVARRSAAADRLKKLFASALKEASFDDVVILDNTFGSLMCVIMLLAYVKSFKYVSFNKTSAQLGTTLKRAKRDIGAFSFMFSFIVCGFAIVGNYLFGDYIADYSTMYDSVFSLLRAILGDFNIKALKAANRVLGPAFFIAYVILVFYVMLNLFLAIMSLSYQNLKEEIEEAPEEVTDDSIIEVDLTSLIMRGVTTVKRALCCCLYKKEQKVYILEEWLFDLRCAGFTEDQLQDMFDAHNIEDGHPVTEEDRFSIENKLYKERADRERNLTDLDVVRTRTTLLAGSIDDVDGKIQGVFGEIQRLQKKWFKQGDREHESVTE